MAKLTVLSPVRHDGVDYAVGDTVDVKDKAQAAALIDAGVAEDPKAPAAPAGEGEQ